MYTTTVTKKGTISLPAVLRRKYNILAGSTILIEDGEVLRIVIPEPIEALRARNAIRLARGGFKKGVPVDERGWEAYIDEKYGRHAKKPGHYKNGDGWAVYVMEKYGKKSKAVIKQARKNASNLGV